MNSHKFWIPENDFEDGWENVIFDEIGEANLKWAIGVKIVYTAEPYSGAKVI